MSHLSVNHSKLKKKIFLKTNSGKFLGKNRIFFRWPTFCEILIFFEIFLVYWLTKDLKFKNILICLFQTPVWGEELEIGQIDLSNLDISEIRPYKSKYYGCIRLKAICFILQEYLNKPQKFWNDSLFFSFSKKSPKIPKFSGCYTEFPP